MEIPMVPLPFEFIVDGPPVSHQTKNPSRLREWKSFVRAEVAKRWPMGLPPISVAVKITVVYYHDGEVVRIDEDNMIKPIQDAMNGLVYEDDRQVTDVSARKTDLNGSFRVRGLSPVLAEGFCRDREFLHVRVEARPDHQDLL
jgi:crossover junction endodeoxyribonuclease RusA